MSYNRCFQLLNLLRFDNKDTRPQRRETDKLAPRIELLNLHLSNLQRYYVPGANLTVDEQLIPFRGRCPIIQYIPSKPAKYGLKLFWICNCIR
ncbi:PiggyBac transposable element-derived protein 4 [Elysia marginata]|uniref:PiggyBac transposable element-derived protein 4 n=1 Tax=Elysia marginata TaxID=1093978 RepID=A0AAV4HWE7_9GAST|nr:PiggyBac transposable element-derived protein 4 [Elysia marginata]